MSHVASTPVLLLVAFQFAMCPSCAGQGIQGDTPDDNPRNPLRSLGWFIGDWEHANADAYNKVNNLSVSWTNDHKAIEVTYSYTHYPGFCESAGFECTETIGTSKNGKLSVKFHCKLTHDYALLPLADASGEYCHWAL